MSRGFLPSTAGTKRALTTKVLAEIFAHWAEVDEKTGKSRGQMTLSYLYRSDPANYARLVASLLPKDLNITSSTSDMDDNQLDDVINRIQERLIDARAATARPVRGIEPRAIASRISEPAGGKV
jgi:hypothetical protein